MVAVDIGFRIFAVMFFDPDRDFDSDPDGDPTHRNFEAGTGTELGRAWFFLVIFPKV